MSLTSFLWNEAVVHRVGWTLLHLVWQGAAVAAVFAIASAVLRRRAANVRYVAGCMAMLVLAAAPVATFLALPARADMRGAVAAPPAPALQPIPVVPPAAEPPPVAGARVESTPAPPSPALARPADAVAVQPEPIPWRERVEAWLRPLLPWCVAVWLAGVVVLSFWQIAAWVQAQRSRHAGTEPVAASLQAAARRLAEALGIGRAVRLLASARVAAPMAIGWLRPAVLLPASALMGLAPDQIEAILAHELAHIRRYDYLVNLLQTVVETLLFYHPAVWWISRRVRIEREHCCDDLAVAACGDRVVYARALASLAEQRLAPRPAVAATGGSLLDRVRRILGLQPSRPVGRRTTLAGILVLGLLLTLGILYGCAMGRQVTSSERPDRADGAWSAPAGGLEGRLVLALPRISETDWFALKLELRNVGEVPLAVQTGNPFLLDVRVADAKGQAVKPTWTRSDVLFSPKWAEIAPKSSLSVQVSEKSIDGAKGSHLDVTTSIWKLEPGKYRVSATCKSQERGAAASSPYKGNARLWSGQLALPEIEVEVLRDRPWGEAVEGVQARLRAEKAQWKAGETPTLKADLRNQSHFVHSWDLQQIEVDGAWYGLLDRPRGPSLIPPGQTLSDIAVTLGRQMRHVELEALFRLRAGAHTVRARFSVGPEPRGGIGIGPTWEVMTNPVRITVEGGEPEAEAGFTVDDIARRTMEKAPAGGMMDFDAVPAYSVTGEWREGLDLKAHGWVGRGAARFETRPGSSVRILALTSDEIVDAFREAYRRRRELRGGFGPQVEAKPGRFFALVTDGLSARGLEKPMDPRPEPKPRLVILRVDRYETYDGVQHILYRWWHEKAERFIAEGDDPQEPAWGEAVEGVKARLRAEKAQWKAGETPELKADVRNNGNRELFVAQAQQLCELEVDGKWHPWVGDIDVKSSAFGPGREYRDIRITLDDHWHTKEGDKPLRLEPGKHAIRVAFIATPSVKGQGGPVRAVSNPAEIEILPAEGQGQREPKAGEAIAGLACRARLIKEKLLFGESARLEVTLTNVSDRSLDLVGESRMAGRTPEWPLFPCVSVRLDCPDGKYSLYSLDLVGDTTRAVRLEPGKGWSFPFPPQGHAGFWGGVQPGSQLPHLSALLPGTYTAEVSYFIREHEAQRVAASLAYGPEAGALAGKKPERLWQGVVRSLPAKFEVLDDGSKALAILRGIYAGEGKEHLRLKLRRDKDGDLLLAVENTGRGTLYLGSDYWLCKIGPDGREHASGDGPRSGVATPVEPGKTKVLGAWAFGNGEGEKPGRHTVWVKYLTPTHQLVAESNRIETDVPDRSATGWGEAVEGVQARLRAEKAQWSVGETPILKACVRSLQRALFVDRTQELFELDIDGQWFCYGREVSVQTPLAPPGTEYNDIPITLDDRWCAKAGNQRLKLAAGKHTIRVVFHARADAGGEPIRAVTNPAEIQILALLPGSGMPLEDVKAAILNALFAPSAAPRPKTPTRGAGERAGGADEKKAPGTVAELAEREAPDDYDALLKLAAEEAETKGFYALLKLRDRGDGRAVPVLEKVLARELPGTRIHGFAAAQALSCIGTPEAHQLLARYLNTPQYHANLAVDYAFHWDMAPAKRDAFIERYHLTSTSKDLTVSLGAERQGTGEIVFTIAVRNVSNKPFRVHKPGDYVGKLLVLRAAGGQFVNRWEIVRLHAAQLTFDQMYPTLEPGASHTWRIVTRPRRESDKVWHPVMRAPQGLLLASQDVAHFVGKPGKFQAYVLFDVAPLTKQQLEYHKVGDPERVWCGRVVSNPVEITIPAAP